MLKEIFKNIFVTVLHHLRFNLAVRRCRWSEAYRLCLIVFVCCCFAFVFLRARLRLMS